MGSFKGFSPKISPVQIPENFFTELVPTIENLQALKILLLAFQSASLSEEQISYFVPESMCADYFSNQEQAFWQGLELAIENRWLLPAELSNKSGESTKICFLNTPRAVAAIEAIEQGQIKFSEGVIEIKAPQRPDIFKLYEENIGPLTPIIADSLKDLEATYPPDWISKAIQVAVKNSARSLRYIEVVLQNWQEEGKYERTDRRRRKETEEEFDPEGYTDGEFSDFIEY